MIIIVLCGQLDVIKRCFALFFKHIIKPGRVLCIPIIIIKVLDQVWWLHFLQQCCQITIIILHDLPAWIKGHQGYKLKRTTVSDIYG